MDCFDEISSNLAMLGPVFRASVAIIIENRLPAKGPNLIPFTSCSNQFLRKHNFPKLSRFITVKVHLDVLIQK